ncbi:Protein FAR1-RELATED SEQUENCE [Abeliophyllum distichum]|uniref:Protein FAR1-RELATED SEQUENCE n=1 Tax=Abeliophyllum distichum TaxID=126358 RepID=A0ABD1SGK8_9LAMI
MRSKVEKEFQADFKSFAQMLPCATKYDMEKQFQEKYTISKFKEFQEEFIGKVYCEVISSEEGCSVTKYEIADLVADDEERTREIRQSNELATSRSRLSCASNLHSQQSVQVGSESTEARNNATEIIFDPNLSRTKGAPKKIRRKGPLETRSKQTKGAEYHHWAHSSGLNFMPNVQMQCALLPFPAQDPLLGLGDECTSDPVDRRNV